MEPKTNFACWLDVFCFGLKANKQTICGLGERERFNLYGIGLRFENLKRMWKGIYHKIIRPIKHPSQKHNRYHKYTRVIKIIKSDSICDKRFELEVCNTSCSVECIRSKWL